MSPSALPCIALASSVALVSFASLLAAGGCGGSEGRGEGGGISGAGLGSGATGEGSSGSSGSGEGSSGGSGEGSSGGGSSGGGTTGTTGGSTSGSSGGSTSADDLPPLRSCVHRSTTFAAPPAELMVAKGSSEALVFSIPELPAPELVEAATLRFVGHDLDHPGEEGVIVVNGGAPIDLPAELGWENADQTVSVAITGRTVEGANEVSFGAGSFAGGTFYRISAVEALVDAHVEACPAAPAGPPMSVQIGYEDAVYTERHNWVLRCDFGEGYAFTAKGADQLPLDCGKLYDPDGKRTGTATFTFVDLPAATYRVSIRSRHSVNRNPKGALFVVEGEGRRVPQNDAQDFATDVWGEKALAGTVTVVLDSAQEGESDSVTWVRLDPI